MPEHNVSTVTYLPNCDMCHMEEVEEPAEYDAHVPGGGWASLCQKHFDKFGCSLGLGHGQKLVKSLKPLCEHKWKNLEYDMDGKQVQCTLCNETQNVELDSDIGGRLWFI